MKKIYFSGNEYFNDHILYVPMEYREKVISTFNDLKPTIFKDLDKEAQSLINQIIRLQKVFREMSWWIEWQANDHTFSGTAMWAYFEKLKNEPIQEVFTLTPGVIYHTEEAFVNCNEGLPLSILRQMWKDCVTEITSETLVQTRNRLIETGSRGLRDREELAISFMRENNQDNTFADFVDHFGNSEFEFWLRF